MFRRFVSGSAVASIAIACAVFVALVAPGLDMRRIYPLAFVWCLVPFTWGLWAWLAPSSWVPERLPLWGAILGAIAGLFGAFVLNLPARILGEPVPALARSAGVLVLLALYYFLWMLVRLAYRSLSESGPVIETPVSAKAA